MSETAEFNTTTLIVDDTSNLIKYSAGWTPGFSGVGVPDTEAEYMRTKHGAKTAGPTATFSFTGTSVAVYGSLGSFDVYGVPVSSYSVDGVNNGTYTAPIVQPGTFQTHLLFYQSPSLAPGRHELVITNLNGTAPSVLWVDFIYYDPSPSTGETGGGAGPISYPSAALSSASALPTAVFSNTNMPASSDTTPSSSPKHVSVNAVVGGAVGAALLLILSSVTLFLCYRRRKRRQIGLHETTTIAPFRYEIASFSTTPNSFHTVENPSTNRTSTVRQSSGTLGTSAAMSGPPMIWHTDSGIRLPNPVEVPPEYTQH